MRDLKPGWRQQHRQELKIRDIESFKASEVVDGLLNELMQLRHKEEWLDRKYWKTVAEDSQHISFDNKHEQNVSKDDSNGRRSTMWPSVYQSGINKKTIMGTSTKDK